MHDFRFSVAEILGRPGELRDLDVHAPLEGVGTALATLEGEPLEGRLRAESVVEGVLVTGAVTGAVELRCARCLKAFSSRVGVDVCELFTAPGHEGDEDAYRVTGIEIDLEPMLRDAVTLELPLRPLCRDDCKGLCARCGTDLNQDDCTCVDEDLDPRWAGLSAIKDKLG